MSQLGSHFLAGSELFFTVSQSGKIASLLQALLESFGVLWWIFLTEGCFGKFEKNRILQMTRMMIDKNDGDDEEEEEEEEE